MGGGNSHRGENGSDKSGRAEVDCRMVKLMLPEGEKLYVESIYCQFSEAIGSLLIKLEGI